jgi:hypothetical protein
MDIYINNILNNKMNYDYGQYTLYYSELKLSKINIK